MSEFKVEFAKDAKGVTETFGITQERSKELKLSMTHTMLDIMAAPGDTVHASEIITAFASIAKTQNEAYFLIFYAGTRLEKIQSGNIQDLY